MEKREKIVFGFKSVIAFYLIFMVLNMSPVDQLNIWMQMAIAALIGFTINDIIDKLLNLFVSKEKKANDQV
ncbi:MAG: hypothetical protein R6U02_04620 [Alkalibacterium sp.]|uniref:hypothetical protein n=1 Tax=Alkalibacterium sp. TaxID=1872447 RepID=UPI0039709117